MTRAEVTQETCDAASKCLNRNNGDPDDRTDKIQLFEGIVKVTVTGASDAFVLAQNRIIERLLMISLAKYYLPGMTIQLSIFPRKQAMTINKVIFLKHCIKYIYIYIYIYTHKCRQLFFICKNYIQIFMQKYWYM